MQQCLEAIDEFPFFAAGLAVCHDEIDGNREDRGSQFFRQSLRGRRDNWLEAMQFE